MSFSVMGKVLIVITILWGGNSAYVLTKKEPQTLTIATQAEATQLLQSLTSVSSSSKSSDVSTAPSLIPSEVPSIQPTSKLYGSKTGVKSPSFVATDTSNPATNPEIHITPTPSVSVAITPTPQPAPVIAYQINAGSPDLKGNLVSQSGTVASITQAITQKHGTTFEYEITPMGWFVTEIAGVKQNPAQNKWWVYYINGQLGNKAVNEAVVEPGDSLVWQLTH